MPGSHDFCVTRTYEHTQEKFHARFKFGDLDPGKEAARVLTVQQFRRPGVVSVGATDYDPGVCPGDEVHEFSASASPEQLQSLANAVGAGDVAGAAVVATAIVAGTTEAVVKGAGDVVQGAVEAVGNFLKKPFG
jgi:hypothetical protein